MKIGVAVLALMGVISGQQAKRDPVATLADSLINNVNFTSALAAQIGFNL